VCYRHSLSDAEWRDKARLGGLARAHQSRGGKSLRDFAFAPGVTLGRAVEIIHELLDARISDTGEPDYLSRAYGVMALALLFKVRDRDELLDLLLDVAPQVIENEPQPHRLLDELEEARQNLIRAYEAGVIAAEDLPPGVLKLDRPLSGYTLT
jgi:hypothetical protein